MGKRIGSGAMGTVYEAICDGRSLAVKVLNRLQSAQVYRLKTEFRRLSQLSHPNVVAVYELFNEDEEWFFTMERVLGLPMHRHLAARALSDFEGSWDAELRILLRQLFEGVAAIHGAALVHRDIKPTNVLVAGDGRLVIVDFGLVSEQHPGGVGQTIDNRVSGTVGYIAPEVLGGGAATTASDCYAIGATIHQLVTKVLPIAAPRAPVSNDPGANQPLPPPAATWPPADLLHLCERLLSIQASARPNIDELLEVSRDWSSAALERPTQVNCAAETFVGRDNELKTLRDAYERARSGKTLIAFVHGSRGCGKTALLGNFVVQLRAEGVIVIEGRCSEWESVPYNGLDEVIDNYSRIVLKMQPDQAAHLVPRHAAEVVRVFPTLLRIDAFAEAARAQQSDVEEAWALRLRAVTGMKDALFRLAERHQLAIAIDDLQWVGADTLQVLSVLCPLQRPRTCS